jgi:hypothetical protein
MEKTNKKDMRRGGFYWIDKHPYVSVTQVISVIDKPQLRYWFGKEVYRAMVIDPTLTEQAALAAPYQKSDTAKTRGTTVHTIVESYKHTKEHIETIPEEFKGYATAFYNWVEDNDIEILEHERTVVSKQYEYAGTLDLLVKNKQSNRTFIIDVKTGKDIYPESFLQLSAYKQALKEGGTEVNDIAVLLLKEDGKYKFGQGENCLEVFLAAKLLWEWKNPDLMEIIKAVKKGESQKG